MWITYLITINPHYRETPLLNHLNKTRGKNMFFLPLTLKKLNVSYETTVS